ncbi:hypothetical protein A3H66_02100 [Candidatus Falkowbacteria bacterium RIFCSPLOWO2_02_FULL_45_21]|uniref:Uncharacterized protein n=1 Tax=Candidatus Falkowbacteria bacterium RIFCSPLOWO2_02_FULL_45_21 TaxID=1797989 RepID=A0A1F5SCK8_9BACT|nr:MAG: hypothetical protein A3H66_02100 [Candidatus Falkowbacteria bacterium RIFCSPLOWO2_02_FULL_45_21]
MMLIALIHQAAALGGALAQVMADTRPAGLLVIFPIWRQPILANYQLILAPVQTAMVIYIIPTL